MSEFGPNYRAITHENVLAVPVEAGIAIAGLGKIRPFGFLRSGTHHNMLALVDEELNPVALRMGSQFSGLPGIYEAPRRRHTPLLDSAVRISFQYYKAANGHQEPNFRDITIVPGEVSVGYGVHSDHQGEAPAWYIRGYHVGFSALDPGTRQLTPGAEVEGDPALKNFSLARVVGGPMGDPATDEVFRQRTGIAEILPVQS